MKRLFILFIVLLLPCGAVFSQKKESYHVRTVVIDPGHGGAKPGARGGRSYEKNITLSVAKKFGKLIRDNYPDVKIIYTRTTDVDISLAERARIANRNKADLFISIHANSHPTSTPTGVETFVMGLSESKANLEVAKKENADILLEEDYKNNKDYSVFDPNSPESYVLLTMFQNAYLDKSLNFAQAIQTQYKQNLKTINRGVKQAELFVLYKTTCPSVLTEIGFISNPAEEAFMLSDEGQAKIAVSLFNAFMVYKATEEGSNRITSPKIDLPGYRSPVVAKQEEAKPQPEEAMAEQVQEEVKEPEPVVEQSVTEPEPKQPEPEQPAVQPAAPEPKAAEPEAKPAAPTAKPTPTEELPQRVEPQPQQQPVEKMAEEPAAAPEEEPKAEPAPEPKTQPSPVQPRPTLQAPQNTAAADAASYYTVQFLTSTTQFKADARELDGIKDYKTIRKGKAYAYITGRFATMQEAVAYNEHIHSTTRFKDSWVYLYKEPKADEAKPAQEPVAKTNGVAKEKSVAASAVKGLVYRVQFCTSTKVLKPGDPDLQGVKDIHMGQSGNYYIYTAGDYTNVQDANKRCATLKKTTKFKDAFVIAIYNGERVTLEQAAALGKKK